MGRFSRAGKDLPEAGDEELQKLLYVYDNKADWTDGVVSSGETVFTKQNVSILLRSPEQGGSCEWSVRH